jgi:predicted transcriptional regulator
MDFSGAERTLALAVALGTVAGAWGWRTIARRRTRRTVVRGLADPDEGRRIAMIAAITAQGLGANAAALDRLARRENSPAVRQALALAVARNQWEPAADRRLVALRVWAHEELARRPVDGRAALTLAPRLDAPVGIPVLIPPVVPAAPAAAAEGAGAVR